MCEEKGEILEPTLNENGYLQVDLYNKEGIKNTKEIHMIVAETFIPNPNDYKYVRHINGDKTDNRAPNLEWAKCPEEQ